MFRVKKVTILYIKHNSLIGKLKDQERDGMVVSMM